MCLQAKIGVRVESSAAEIDVSDIGVNLGDSNGSLDRR